MTAPEAQPLERLVAQTRERYRRLAQETLPALAAQNQEVANAEPKLAGLNEKLAAHIRREEELLYPILLQMIAAPEPKTNADGSLCTTAPCRFCTVGHTLFLFEQEHATLNALAGELAQALKGAAAETAAKALAEELATLTRIEDDAIFPRTIQLERKLKGLPATR